MVLERKVMIILIIFSKFCNIDELCKIIFNQSSQSKKGYVPPHMKDLQMVRILECGNIDPEKYSIKELEYMLTSFMTYCEYRFKRKTKNKRGWYYKRHGPVAKWRRRQISIIRLELTKRWEKIDGP